MICWVNVVPDLTNVHTKTSSSLVSNVRISSFVASSCWDQVDARVNNQVHTSARPVVLVRCECELERQSVYEQTKLKRLQALGACQRFTNNCKKRDCRDVNGVVGAKLKIEKRKRMGPHSRKSTLLLHTITHKGKNAPGVRTMTPTTTGSPQSSIWPHFDPQRILLEAACFSLQIYRPRFFVRKGSCYCFGCR